MSDVDASTRLPGLTNLNRAYRGRLNSLGIAFGERVGRDDPRYGAFVECSTEYAEAMRPSLADSCSSSSDRTYPELLDYVTSELAADTTAPTQWRKVLARARAYLVGLQIGADPTLPELPARATERKARDALENLRLWLQVRSPALWPIAHSRDEAEILAICDRLDRPFESYSAFVDPTEWTKAPTQRRIGHNVTYDDPCSIAETWHSQVENIRAWVNGHLLLYGADGVDDAAGDAATSLLHFVSSLPKTPAAPSALLTDVSRLHTLVTTSRPSIICELCRKEFFRHDAREQLCRECLAGRDRIEAIHDVPLRQRTAEAWKAVVRLKGCIAPWHRWVMQLKDTGDADPGEPIRLYESVALSTEILCRLGINSQSFIGADRLTILRKFPAVTLGEMAQPAIVINDAVAAEAVLPWQKTYDLVEANERLCSLWKFSGELLGIRQLLENAPSTVFVAERPRTPSFGKGTGGGRTGSVAANLAVSTSAEELETESRGAPESYEKCPRPTYARNMLWLQWAQEFGLDQEKVYSRVRDRWNQMPESEREEYAPFHQLLPKGNPGWDRVRKGIEAALMDNATMSES